MLEVQSSKRLVRKGGIKLVATIISYLYYKGHYIFPFQSAKSRHTNDERFI